MFLYLPKVKYLMIGQIKQELKSLANEGKSKAMQRFFRTGKGEYAEGDVFLGLTSQQIKDVAKRYPHLGKEDITLLLNSPIHEERICALRIMMGQYKKARKDRKKRIEIFDVYVKNMKSINNWDLVDISAPHIVGDFLQGENDGFLLRMAQSENMWERRIAIVSTYSFIRKNNFGETLVIAEMLIKDEQDLIHKATGWMLREVGKRNKKVLELFLMQRYKDMPRTMLRYAIEKFPEEERKKYLRGEI